MFSRSKKKLKHLLTGRKKKSGGTGPSETGGANVGSAGLVSQPVPYIVVSGTHDLEDDGASAGGRQGSMDQLPQKDEPEPVPACGSEAGQEGREADIDGGEVGQRYSHPHPDIEVVVGSGPSRKENDVDEVKAEQVCPSPSTPPVPHGGKPDGM